MGKLSLRQLAVIAAHALMLWVLCGALMFAGESARVGSVIKIKQIKR